MSDNLERGLGRVEGKLDGLIELIKAQQADLKTHDTRLDAIEKDQHTSKAFISVIAGIAGALASNITSIIGWIKG